MEKRAGRIEVTVSQDRDAEPSRHRRWWRRMGRRLLLFIIMFLCAMLLLRVIGGWLYQGPLTMPQVVQAMPGVPIFPLMEVAPSNNIIQHAMAFPITLMKLQGAQQVEVVQLQAPADGEFIAEWYKRLAPVQGWSYIGQQRIISGRRLLFRRLAEGLQITIGRETEIFTPVQFIYLQGLTDRQVAQLAGVFTPPLPVRIAGKPAFPLPNTVTRSANPPSELQQPLIDTPSVWLQHAPRTFAIPKPATISAPTAEAHASSQPTQATGSSSGNTSANRANNIVASNDETAEHEKAVTPNKASDNEDNAATTDMTSSHHEDHNSAAPRRHSGDQSGHTTARTARHPMTSASTGTSSSPHHGQSHRQHQPAPATKTNTTSPSHSDSSTLPGYTRKPSVDKSTPKPIITPAPPAP